MTFENFLKEQMYIEFLKRVLNNIELFTFGYTFFLVSENFEFCKPYVIQRKQENKAM